MKKSRNKWKLVGVAIMLVAILVVGYRMYYNYKQSKIIEGIAENIIRFHVRAESDSSEDQELKMKVKENVIRYIKPFLEKSESLDQSREILEQHTEDIKEIAIKTLRDEGSDAPVNVYFEHSFFPVKEYGDMVFPAGQYEAFRIDIGEANGKNWWCVLYPPLCFVDSAYGVVPEESKLELSKHLTKDEYEAITRSRGSKNYKVKFKYLTFLNDWLGL